MSLARGSKPFHQTVVIWTTLGSLAVVLAFLSVISFISPAAASEIGFVNSAFLVLGILIIGFVAHYANKLSYEQTVLHSLQRISDHSQGLVEGAVNGNITLDANAVGEVVLVAEGINRLAQKAMVDIAEMKRLERVRGEFIGNVSHELRTPIFSVQGYLETLLDGAIQYPNVSKQFLEKAYNNALRLNALLNDLIDISRIESGELRMSFRYLDICELIQEVSHSLEINASQKHVNIVLDLPPDEELLVYADKDRIVQVMTNLIENAIKYNVENGQVRIIARHSENGVHVSVQDTGIGIPQEHQHRIFERFYRVDRDRSRAVGGTGLGLAIVKHILEAHQASLSVESEPGKGTSISFDLRGSQTT